MSVTLKLNDLSVGKKLALGCTTLVLISAVLLYISISEFQSYRDRSIVVAAVGKAESRLYNARAEEKNVLLHGDSRHLDLARQYASEAATSVASVMELAPGERKHIQAIIDGAEVYKDQLTKLFQNLGGDPHLLEDIETNLVNIARAGVSTMSDLERAQVTAMNEEYDRAVRVLTIISIIGIILAFIVARYLISVITTPIHDTVEVANRVAAGDLTITITSDRKDELGALLNAFATMVGRLRTLISEIDAGASNIASASEELSAVTHQSRQGALEQRDQTDQVATAMNEMVATVNDVAKSAEAAFNAAQIAGTKSNEGQSAVNQTLQYVTDLNTEIQDVRHKLQGLQKETQSIETVLDVIKSVAEQTNLLALNAAIEAARAGEQGRGFAVVADEVRSLAQRTQTSAQEIESLIANLVVSAENSVSSMESGTELANQTLERARMAGTTIQEMADAVESIRQYNSQIATAAEEQASVAEEINQNVTLIRDVSDQSATSTEQVSVASDELARLAEGLSTQVAQFKI